MKTQKSLQQTSAVDYQLYTDASNTGESDTDHKINGRWSETGKTLHINRLERLVIKFPIRAFLPLQHNIKPLGVMSDKTTAIAYIHLFI